MKHRPIVPRIDYYSCRGDLWQIPFSEGEKLSRKKKQVVRPIDLEVVMKIAVAEFKHHQPGEAQKDPQCSAHPAD